jgi:hypothetical protein
MIPSSGRSVHVLLNPEVPSVISVVVEVSSVMEKRSVSNISFAQ